MEVVLNMGKGGLSTPARPIPHTLKKMSWENHICLSGVYKKIFKIVDFGGRKKRFLSKRGKKPAGKIFMRGIAYV